MLVDYRNLTILKVFRNFIISVHEFCYLSDMSKASTSNAMFTFREAILVGRIRNKFDNSNLGIKVYLESIFDI